ncbi:S4 domain-containing protein YaaA [Amphibacillus sp. MSJ-3]|uniref:S4 domain-containing protein YaaA n=1 Tax=Amphibacillus sp. MSJ-3 TaxID=2841505 RepID=UPI001C0EC2EE|nr:S4 domain-containing protein YaaA [Amphibacillus sp. MSJ-3]MBU5594438.1 S4 domain-containing protein YaaA [Amphibacillus sp. MSJ-3]
MQVEVIKIHTEYIQLGQFLKLAGIVDTGGNVKIFLAEVPVKINGDPDQRRGRKLYPGDRIEIKDLGTYRIEKE